MNAKFPATALGIQSCCLLVYSASLITCRIVVYYFAYDNAGTTKSCIMGSHNFKGTTSSVFGIHCWLQCNIYVTDRFATAGPI